MGILDPVAPSKAASDLVGQGGNPGPADNGLQAWNYDPIIGSSTSILAAAGTLYACRLRLAKPATLSNLWVQVLTAGATLTAGRNLAGLFNASGVLLSATGDQSTAWQSTGAKQMALTTPQACAAGYYFVGFFATGTTLPTLLRANNGGTGNVNVSALTARSISADTSLTTAMPSTMTGVASYGVHYWVGAS